MKPDDRTSWHIIGNGAGLPQTISKQHTICFNHPKHSTPKIDLVISNKLNSGITKSFELKGIEPYEGFEGIMSEKAVVLQQQLNAWPSLGLTTLFALQCSQTQLSLSCMNLLPSITRLSSLHNRKPLPCTFHNWLGERRLALSILQKLNWPSFWLTKTSNLPPISEDPYPDLMALPNYERGEGLERIKHLDSFTESSWYYYATDVNLVKVEALFLLQRDKQQTMNWWLYDHEASSLMANIHRRLALAQQLLHSSRIQIASLA